MWRPPPVGVVFRVSLLRLLLRCLRPVVLPGSWFLKRVSGICFDLTLVFRLLRFRVSMMAVEWTLRFLLLSVTEVLDFERWMSLVGLASLGGISLTSSLDVPVSPLKASRV